jgi:hypothetical protein
VSNLTKHIAALYLAIFYLTLSIGVKVDLHYCLGDLKDFKLFSYAEQKDSCCSDNFCAVDRDFSCCDSKAFFYQLEEDQINAGIDFNLKSYSNLFTHQVQEFHLLPASSGKIRMESNSPPDTKAAPQPAYLLNCSFIFYG